MTPDTPPPQIGALLRMAWEENQEHVYQGLRAAGFDDIRPAHRPFLRHPPVDGMRPGQLAAARGLSKQATNDLLRDLEGMGYLRLEPDPEDGRARIIRLTDRGWDFFRTGSRLSAEVGERWAERIGRDRYAALLDALRAIVGEPAAPGDQTPATDLIQDR